ncbi:hypothetical protein F5X99DRAFT_386843 [Biscogniauxia marginata]|nr:hypothetical protein F5X99DRAFT_386843 [Biscogniauxia marginata]
MIHMTDIFYLLVLAAFADYYFMCNSCPRSWCSVYTTHPRLRYDHHTHLRLNPATFGLAEYSVTREKRLQGHVLSDLGHIKRHLVSSVLGGALSVI